MSPLKTNFRLRFSINYVHFYKLNYWKLLIKSKVQCTFAVEINVMCRDGGQYSYTERTYVKILFLLGTFRWKVFQGDNAETLVLSPKRPSLLTLPKRDDTSVCRQT